jgi:putative methionine-R-sulfoxide reductase with GAF domain
MQSARLSLSRDGYLPIPMALGGPFDGDVPAVPPRTGELRKGKSVRSSETGTPVSTEPTIGLSEPVKVGFLERRGVWGWLLGGAMATAGVASLVAVGLIVSSSNAEVSLGHWTRNQPILMVVLVLTNLLFIGYAAYQQRAIMATRKNRQHQRLLAILTVNRIMGAETDPQTTLDAITDICRKTYPCDQVSLMLMDHASQVLKMCSASGHKDLTLVLDAEQEVGKGIVGWVAEHRKPLILGTDIDTSKFEDFEAKTFDLAAAMVVPIVVRGELFGVLSVSARTKKIRYDEEDLEALQVFAETAGICCRHAEQSKWMRQTIQRLDEELARNDDGTEAKAA